MRLIGFILTVIGLAGSVGCAMAISVYDLYASRVGYVDVGMWMLYVVAYLGMLMVVYSFAKRKR